MTTWKSFLTRAASALVALAIIIGLYFYMGVNGIKVLISLAVAVGSWELVGILFKKESSWLLKISFMALTLITFGFTSVALHLGILVFALAVVLLCILSLLTLYKQGDLPRIADFQAKSVLGLVYLGLFPAFVFRLLEVMQGLSWFIFLLAVVFAGDTMAYIFGVLIGKHKVMPSVSPKKTWQGSVGGIIGSVLAGFISWNYLLSNYPVGFILGLAAVSGFVGQFGDFFESLLKRIADIKDSGKIMPGHGGVLDRIDGVLFASPVIFFGVVILSHLLS